MLKLTAVNLILRSSGSLAVPALDTDGRSQQADAERCLDEEELAIQSAGWYYNTRRNVLLTPDATTGRITLQSVPESAGVISIDADMGDIWRNVTQVGDDLYDLDNNTDVFSGQLRATYVLRYDFECVPEPVARYIACQAAVTYYENIPVRDALRLRTLISKRDRALGTAKYFNARTADANILQTTDALQVKGMRNQGNRLMAYLNRRYGW